jgi:ABC-type transport system involved in Fe-S cluster assembly fused permease/ATPase subunit
MNDCGVMSNSYTRNRCNRDVVPDQSAIGTLCHAVQRTLGLLIQGRTPLIIAHRLATVLKAGSIVVMNHGHIVAQGTYRSPMAQGGLYE